MSCGFRRLGLAALLTTTLSWDVPDALAHGGGFAAPPQPPVFLNPPSDPIGGRRPKRHRNDTPGEGKGPITPSDPSAPPRPPGPTTPSDPTIPAPTPTPAVEQRSRPKADDWRDWWDAHADLLRDLRPRHERLVRQVTPKGGEAAESPEAAHRRRIDTSVLPALRTVVETETGTQYDTLAASLLALAKATSDPADAARIEKALTNRWLPDIDEEAAVLALGCLRRTTPPTGFDGRFYDRLRARLFEVIDDESRSSRTRGFAAMALGLLGDQTVDEADPFAKDGRLAVQGLWSRVEKAETDDDTAVALLIGLSLQRPNGVPPETLVALRRLAKSGEAGTRKRSPVVRCHAIEALARLKDAETIAIATANLKLTPRDPGMRRSAVLALGTMGRTLVGATDGPARESIAKSLAEHAKAGDVATTGLATIEAARVFAAGLATGPASDALVSFSDVLIATEERGTAAARPFAALALGLLVRPTARTTADVKFAALRERALESLRTIYIDDAEDPVLRGAFAVALGVAVEPRARAMLEANLVERQDAPDLAAFSCAGLGLLGEVPESTLEGIRIAVADRSTRDPRREAVIALGLLNDGKAVPGLIATVRADGADHIRACSVRALGAIDDPASVAPLLAIVTNPKANDTTRALAAAALGLLCDVEPTPSLRRIGLGLDYLDRIDALEEALSLL